MCYIITGGGLGLTGKLSSSEFIILLTFLLLVMGTNGQLFPLTDNTDGAAIDQVQQQHLFISKLHRLTLG